MAAPVPQSLSAKFVGSFAYLTVKDRLPLILTRAIDTLHRHKYLFLEHHGEEGVEAEKQTISLLSKLLNELKTDKPVIPLTDKLCDTEQWNQYLERQQVLMGGDEKPSWFKSPWLYVECYMYRRIHEALQLNPPISSFDVFSEGKFKSFFDSQKAIILICTCIQDLSKNVENLDDGQLKEEFLKLFQVSLWGNRCDLSISSSEDNSQTSNPLDCLDSLKPFILIDDIESIWSILANSKRTRNDTTPKARVDIILDNAGFELITDLVLADFLLISGLATEIHFHGKNIPWFVSDSTYTDFKWTLRQLKAANHMGMSKCGVKWEDSIKSGVWVYHDDPFWTLPHEFCDMQQEAPNLYAELQKSNLIIFKGDLNYRKLTGDRQWEFTVSFHHALRGFHPAPFCILRTLKSDVQVGLKPGQGEELKATDVDWMTIGKYAVIQFDTPSM
ncbi:damage-control phosphatase ARMT1 [Protopterus annectens]|uniref:damage-control phosphatase ARMT1 n=1 Tax=Protopterus annectens TaxID=7888 RepID=UPI001CFA2CB0|nr:damage-control phosphatase ARMT1 [Protopterus annectens]